MPDVIGMRLSVCHMKSDNDLHISPEVASDLAICHVCNHLALVNRGDQENRNETGCFYP